MFNETNLFFLFLIFALLVVSISWMFFGDAPMFKKRYFSILALALLLFVIGGTLISKPIVDIKNREAELIEVCRNALEPAGYTVYHDCEGKEFYRTLSYQSTKFFPLFPETVTVYFDNGIDDASCDMRWNGSKLEVTNQWWTGVAFCP